MRPTTRPDKPYTAAEILDRIEQHFIVEKNPRCASTGDNDEAKCYYNRTGCAVGCLMTKEDGEEFESRWTNAPLISRVVLDDIYKAYFGNDDDIFRMLRGLQEAHDNPIPTDTFTDRMKRTIYMARRMYVRATPAE